MLTPKETGRAKVADFGLSRMINDDAKQSMSLAQAYSLMSSDERMSSTMTSQVGTIQWMVR